MEAIKGFKQARGHRKGRIMYKDKDKQREATRKATQRYRAKKGDSALSGRKDGLKNARGLPVVDEVSDTLPVIPSCDTPAVIPKRTPKGVTLIDEPLDVIPRRRAGEVAEQIVKKRGKDIKCFADLPPDVQLTIDEISDTPEEKARRTQAAIRYQWLFPNRFYGTGPWATGKPGDANYDGICTTKEPMPPGVIWESEPGAARKIEERLQGR